MGKKITLLLIIIFALIFSAYLYHNKEHINNNESKTEYKQQTYEVLTFNDKELINIVAKNISMKPEILKAIAYVSNEYNEKIYIKNNYPTDITRVKFYKDKIINENYVIYNKNSHKYHTLDCKYGNEIKSPIYLPFNKLQKVSSPCGYCHKKNKPVKNNIKPDLIFNLNKIKIILTDYTNNFKPSNECKSNICKELVKQINYSKSTIDIAIYGYEKVPAIDYAIKNAINRGVKIRLIHDINSKGENIYSDTNYLTQIITLNNCDKDINNVQYTNSLMHNKFFIFDSDTVITGSANLSKSDMSGFNANSIILINSKEIAQIYENEFEQMFNSKFHTKKDKIQNKISEDISVYFSPKDNSIQNAVIPLINNAKKYIYMPVFLITDKNITNALISAKQRGVNVKIITDAVNVSSKSSKINLLRQNGIQVKTENYAGKLHSKSIIIDDKYVLIGSMNFSNSGNTKNDENIIILKNMQAAIFYRKYFEYLWNKIDNYWMTHNPGAESIYSTGSCSDGIDNDYDGKIDMADEGCRLRK